MVRDEELDKEIRRLELRLDYMRRRKKDGKPKSSSGKYVKRAKPDPDMFFYQSEVKDFAFVKKYNTYKEAAVQASKMFVAYHNHLCKVVAKLGNYQEKEALDKLMLKDADNLCER